MIQRAAAAPAGCATVPIGSFGFNFSLPTTTGETRILVNSHPAIIPLPTRGGDMFSLLQVSILDPKPVWLSDAGGGLRFVSGLNLPLGFGVIWAAVFCLLHVLTKAGLKYSLKNHGHCLQ